MITRQNTEEKKEEKHVIFNVFHNGETVILIYYLIIKESF